jgi:N4-gp56 family major capsid protein
MADAYTGVGATTVDQSAYDLAVYHGLRPLLYFDALADVQSTAQSFEGAAVIFTLYTDMAAATTTLNESTDVDAVALSDAQVTVNLSEYGNCVLYTKLLRSRSFVPYDPVVANAISWNAGYSQDLIARNTIQGGTNIRYAGLGTTGRTIPTARDTVEPEDTLVAKDVMRALADLRGGNVMDFGGYYAAMIHPDVSFDLRSATTGAAWRDPHIYSSPENIWKGEIGAFEGFRFVEAPTAPKFADAGSSTTLTDVYRTMFLGRQAIAKAHGHTDGNGPYPMFVPGPVVDKLRRNVPLGWYWYGGYAIFRQAAIRNVESSSSIGSN